MRGDVRDQDDAVEPAEVIVKNTETVAWLGLALIAVGVLPALWAAGELTGGSTELLRHWWSGIAIVPLVLGIAVTAIGIARLSRGTG